MKYSLKNFILWIVLIIIAPTILLLITNFGNSIAKKNSKNATSADNQITTQVPEEVKKENNIPSASNNSSSDSLTNSSDNQNSTNTSTNNNEVNTKEKSPGGNYTVKSGDTLYAISMEFYGVNNLQKGMDKIKEENKLTSDNLQLGQVLKIPNID